MISEIRMDSYRIMLCTHLRPPSSGWLKRYIHDRFFLVVVLVPGAEVVETRVLRLVFAFCGERGSGEGEPRDDAVDSLDDLRTTFSSCTWPCFFAGVLAFRWVRRAGVVGGKGATSSSSSPSISP